MPKEYDELTLEIEIFYAPEDYNNYDDLISTIQDDYGTVVQYLQLTIDENDPRFVENSS
jgi:hypothetical protein